MKIVCSTKIINLDKFESVHYRESLLGASEGFPIEAVRHEPGFLGSTEVEEEIARPKSEQIAKELVAAISDAWLSGASVFNVANWLAERMKNNG